MLLNSEKYGWLLSIIQMKRTLPAGTGSSPYLFFSNTTSPTSQLTRNLQLAWADMKLRGGATFTSLRTAVATFVSEFTLRNTATDLLCSQPHLNFELCSCVFSAFVCFRPETDMGKTPRSDTAWQGSCAMARQLQISTTPWTSPSNRRRTRPQTGL